MNSRIITLIFSLIISINLSAKISTLSICIGEYPSESGWNALGADNDARLIKGIYPQATILSNSNATHKAILKSLNDLTSNSTEGDTVIVHFSGHGQQIFSANSRDEVDLVDEALVPYDADKRKSSTYDGSSHLTDDTFGLHIAQLRKKVGNNGLVIAVIDACHSDSMDKGEADSNDSYRGTDEIFGAESLSQDSIDSLRELYYTKDESQVAMSEGMSNVIFISACGTHQRNYEIVEDGTPYGSLTYYFCKTVEKEGLSNIHDFLSTLFEDMTSDKVMKFHGQNPNIRNTIGWTAPESDSYMPPVPESTSSDGDSENTYWWFVTGAFAVLLLSVVVLCKKRRK